MDSAVPGSNPVHTIYAFSHLQSVYCNRYFCHCIEKGRNYLNKKEAGFGPYFFKMWAIPGLFWSIFVLFSSQFKYKLKMHRRCARGLNPGTQDGRRTQIQRGYGGFHDWPIFKKKILGHIETPVLFSTKLSVPPYRKGPMVLWEL